MYYTKIKSNTLFTNKTRYRNRANYYSNIHIVTIKTYQNNRISKSIIL